MSSTHSRGGYVANGSTLQAIGSELQRKVAWLLVHNWTWQQIKDSH